MIESSVRRAIKRAQFDPRRSLRNLVDLAVESSSGVTQLPFFARVQDMLASDDHNAYFDLVERVVRDVDLEHIVTFGINLGYEGCTKGAHTIRATELVRGFNVPWALSVELPHEAPFVSHALVATLNEARQLGIHVFLVYAQSDISGALDLAELFPDCAFIIFCQPSFLNSPLARRAEDIPQALISILYVDGVEDACGLLRDHRLPCAVHICYTDEVRGEPSILARLSSAMTLKPCFIFTVPIPGCTASTVHAVSRQVMRIRDSKSYAAIVCDAFADRLLIDQVISDGACACGIDSAGNLMLLDGSLGNPRCNVFSRGLANVLEDLFPKVENPASSSCAAVAPTRF